MNNCRGKEQFFTVKFSLAPLLVRNRLGQNGCIIILIHMDVVKTVLRVYKMRAALELLEEPVSKVNCSAQSIKET